MYILRVEFDFCGFGEYFPCFKFQIERISSLLQWAMLCNLDVYGVADYPMKLTCEV